MGIAMSSIRFQDLSTRELLEKAESAKKSKNYETAFNLYSEVQKRDRSRISIRTATNLAQCMKYRGDVDGAIKHLKTVERTEGACRDDADRDLLAFNLAILYKKRYASEKKIEDLKSAREYFLAIRKNSPYEKDVLGHLIDVYFYQNELENMQNAFNTLKRKYPNKFFTLDSRLNIAMKLDNRKEGLEAAIDLLKIEKRPERRVNLLKAFIRCSTRGADLSQQIKELKELSSTLPHLKYPIQLTIAHAYHQSKNSAEAEKVYRDIISSAASAKTKGDCLWEAYNSLATVLLDEGQHREVAHLLENMLQHTENLNSNDTSPTKHQLACTHFFLHLAYETTDREKATYHSNEAIKIDPTYAPAWSQKGKNQKDFYQARKLQETARKVGGGRFEKLHPATGGKNWHSNVMTITSDAKEDKKDEFKTELKISDSHVNLSRTTSSDRLNSSDDSSILIPASKNHRHTINTRPAIKPARQTTKISATPPLLPNKFMLLECNEEISQPAETKKEKQKPAKSKKSLPKKKERPAFPVVRPANDVVHPDKPRSSCWGIFTKRLAGSLETVDFILRRALEEYSFFSSSKGKNYRPRELPDTLKNTILETQRRKAP